MTFVVNLNGLVYGIYETIDLVRTNLMIILIYNLEKQNISVEKYENLYDYLSNSSFTEESLYIPELKDNFLDLDISVEKYNLERNGSCPLEKIMNHINWRFICLKKHMEKDSRVKITIPGENSENHQLGPPYYDDWKLVDMKNHHKLTSTLHQYISKKIKELEKIFGKERVRFGEVLFDNASKTSYQLWSANGINWDLPDGTEIPGKFQAEQMRFQDPGVFGIVVTPIYGYHSLVPEDYEQFIEK
jgi:hypothetical protein